MNIKQITCLVVSAVGVLLICYGLYSKSHVKSAETELHQMAQSKNPIVQSMSKSMGQKISYYDHKVKWSFFGGAVLVLFSGGAAYLYRNRKKKRK